MYDKVSNKNLVAVNYHYFIDGKEYKVLTFGRLKGVAAWYCTSLNDNNRRFAVGKDYLDEKIRENRNENKHLL